MRILDPEVVNLAHFTSVKEVHTVPRHRGRFQRFTQDLAPSRPTGSPRHVKELTHSLQRGCTQPSSSEIAYWGCKVSCACCRRSAVAKSMSEKLNIEYMPYFDDMKDNNSLGRWTDCMKLGSRPKRHRISLHPARIEASRSSWWPENRSSRLWWSLLTPLDYINERDKNDYSTRCRARIFSPQLNYESIQVYLLEAQTRNLRSV